MDATNCAAVLLSVPISYHFHGCAALLVALVVVSGAILKIHTFTFTPILNTLESFVFDIFCGQTDKQTTYYGYFWFLLPAQSRMRKYKIMQLLLLLLLLDLQYRLFYSFSIQSE